MASNDTSEISINESSYLSAIKKIENANERTDDNISNITVSYGSCDMSYLTNYQDTILKLSELLQNYRDVINKDITSLKTTLDNFKEVDK